MATEKEIDVSRGQGVAGRKHSRAENQEALAESYLRCGAVQQYCELMTRLHQWDHALALAPAVSVDYWRKLMARYEITTFMLLSVDIVCGLDFLFHLKILPILRAAFCQFKKTFLKSITV